MSKKEVMRITSDMLIPASDLNVPLDAFIHCPGFSFKLRQSKLCHGCEHFNGYINSLENDDLPFTSQYKTICSYPVVRTMQQVELPK